MPYITEDKREEYNDLINQLILRIDKNGFSVGDINYIISKIIWSCWKRMGSNYTSGNNLIGVINCVGLEFYRQRLAKYEEEKMESNGDVIEYDK